MSLTRTEAMALWSQVQDNGRALRSCGGHDFAPDGPAQPLRTRYRCTRCNGTIDAHAYHWYMVGRQGGMKAAA